MSQRTEINAPFSKESIASAEKMKNTITSMRKEMVQLQQAFAEITRFSKEAAASGLAMQKPGGYTNSRVLQGMVTQGSIKRENLGFLGSQQGTDLSTLQQQNKLSERGLDLARLRAKIQAGENVDLQQSLASLRRITDQKNIEARLDALKTRQGAEIVKGNDQAVQRAQQMITVLEKQLAIQKEQDRLTKLAAMPSSASVAALRAQQANRLLMNAGNPAGIQQAQVLSGLAVAGTVKLSNTVSAGTKNGIDLANLKEANRLSQTGLQLEDMKVRAVAAENLNLNQTSSSLRKIESQKRIEGMLDAVKLRLGTEIQNEDATAVANAKRIQDVLEKRLALLKAEVAEKQRLLQLQTLSSEAELAALRAQAAHKLLSNAGTSPSGIQSDQILQGMQAQAALKRDNLARLGSNFGQDLTSLQQQNSLSQQGLQTDILRQRIMVGNSINLQQNLNSLRLITDQEKIQSMLEGLKHRQGQEAAAGNAENVGRAKAMVTVLKEQLSLLQAQEREQAALSKMRAPQSNTAQRAQTVSKLFSDGGASLLAVQAGLSVNYAILGGLQNLLTSSIKFTVDLDNDLHNLQAITASTTGSMVGLKETIIAVAQSTKFSATEVAGAAQLLAQAGLSVDQIQNTLSAVATLATATGSELSKAVDIASSILNVYELDTSQMASVANTLTTAVNQSKLDIDKLTLALQYAGNTGAQAGVSFEETTATISAMANAGIRSGSTLGTGFRSVITALEKPSKAFQQRLAQLGLTMSDINLKTNGLYGALKNLSDAGFSSSDAIKSFEIRASAAFIAMSANLDVIQQNEQAFVNSTAATKANEVQMQSLTNVASNFAGAFQTIVETALHPFLLMLRDILQGATGVLEKLAEFPGVIQVIGGALTALAGSFALMVPFKLIKGAVALFAEMKGGLALLRGVPAVVAEVGAVAEGAAVGVGVLARALGVITGPIGWIVTALSLGIGAFVSYRGEMKKLSDAVDVAQTAFDKTRSVAEQTVAQIGEVDNKLQNVADRRKLLTGNRAMLDTEISAVRQQFAAMGIDVNSNITTVDDLIGVLKKLRGELQNGYVIDITASNGALSTLIAVQEQQSNALRKTVDNAQKLYQGAAKSYNNVAASKIPELTTATDPNSGPAQLKAAQYGNNERLAQVQKMLATGMNATNGGPGAGFAGNTPLTMSEINLLTAEKAARTTLASTFSKLIESVVTGAALDAQKKIQDAKMNDAAQMASKPVAQLFEDAAALPGATQTQYDAQTAKLPVGDVQQRGAIAAKLKTQAETQIKALEAVAKTLNLTPGLADDLKNQLGQGENLINEVLNPLIEAAAKEVEALDKIKGEELSGKFKTIMAKKDATDKELNAAFGLIYQRQFIDLRAIRNDATKTQAEQDALVHQRLTQSAEEIKAILDLKKSRNAGSLKDRLETQLADLENLVAQNDGSATDIDKVLELKRSIYDLQFQILNNDTGPNSMQKTTALKGLEAKYQADVAKLLQDQQAAFKNRIGPQIAPGSLVDANSMNIQFASIFSDMTTHVGQAMTLIFDRYDADIAAIKASSTTKDFQDQQLALRAQERDNELKVLNDQIATKGVANAEGGAQNHLQELNLMLVAIQQAEQKAMTLDELNGLASQEASVLQQIAAAQSGIIELDASGVLDTTKPAADLATATADMNARVHAKALELATAAEAIAQAAYDNVLGLSETALTLKDRNDLLTQALEKAKGLAVATLARIGIEFASDPGSQPAANAQVGALMASAAREADIKKRTASKFVAPGTPSGAGGGGGGDKKTETEAFLAEADARLQVAEMVMKVQTADQGVAIASMDQVITDAKGKLDSLNEKLKGIDLGNLSKAEQEKLLPLLKDREALTKFIAENEQKIIQAHLAQQVTLKDILTLTSYWAKDNLDIGATMSDGIKSVLDSAKNSLATFWTEWSEGTKSGLSAFKDFTVSILKSINQVLAQMLAVWAMKKVLGLVGGATGIDMSSVIGSIPGSAMGYSVEGNLNRDSKLHRLMPGETVLTASASKMMGYDTISKMNAMGNRVISRGAVPDRGKSAENKIVNVYVVSPDQKPVMGPNDIIAVITDNVSRGGSVKKLIKSVQMGNM